MQRGFQKQVERQDTVTHSQSLTLIRNLFRTAISSICYLRGLFSEDCFSDRSVVGLNIKSLTTGNRQAAKIVGWLEDGVFDALERRYLSEVVFGVTTDPKDPKALVEAYKFDVKYPDADPSEQKVDDKKENNNNIVEVETTATETATTFKMSMSNDLFKPVSRASVKEATVTLLRRLMAMTQMLPELPERRFIYMGLKYTEETPPDYEPPHFRPTNVTPGLNTTMEIGRVKTGFHVLNLSLLLKESSALQPDTEELNKDTKTDSIQEATIGPAEERTPSPRRYSLMLSKKHIPREDITTTTTIEEEKDKESEEETTKTQNKNEISPSEKIINELKKHNLTLLQLSKATGIPRTELKAYVESLIDNNTLRSHRSKLYIV